MAVIANSIEYVTAQILDLSHEECVERLNKWGFGRPGSAVPSDWSTYYQTDELREFLLRFEFPEAE